MEGCRVLMVGTQVKIYPGPESAYKVGVVISNYVTWNSVRPNGMFKEEQG
jgi:hypothetical protein